MDLNNKLFAGPLFIRNRLEDVIRSAKSEIKLDKDESINYMLMECVNYYKKSGMSIDDFIKKCSTQWTFLDTSLSL